MPEEIDVHEWRREKRQEQTKEEFEKRLKECKLEMRKSWNGDDDRTIPGERETEIEFAFWTNIHEFLPYVLKKEGSFRGARRHINNELEAMSHYDTDEYGKVSIGTLYNWIEKWADADVTSESDRKMLERFNT